MTPSRESVLSYFTVMPDYRNALVLEHKCLQGWLAILCYTMLYSDGLTLVGSGCV